MLLAWELGGGWGHLSSLGALSKRLVHEGFDVTAGLKSKKDARQFLAPGAGIAEAPKLVHSKWTRDPVSFAELMRSHGMDQVQVVKHRVAWWRQLVRQTHPDAIVCDFAPFALAATHRCR